MNATDDFPDCVGFKVQRFEDDREIGEAIHSLRFENYNERSMPGYRIQYERPINHLCPVRTKLAREILFQPTEMEDIDYAMRLAPILRARGSREVFVDEVMYHYRYVSESKRG